MRLMTSLLRLAARVLLGIAILAAVLASAYVLSIGPVSKYALLSEPSHTFPQWCSDLYQPLYELHQVPLAARPLRLYCDMWNVPYWLPHSVLFPETSFLPGSIPIEHDYEE